MSPSLPVEPWCLREQGFDPDALGQPESLFALSNGHLGLRGNLDEGEPVAQQGTYLSGYFEEHALPYAEGGYGYPESGQTIVNVTNGKLIRLLVDDEPFDMRYGQVVSHERVLDFRAGTLRRETDWISPAGRRIIVRSTRLVSFTHRAVAAVAYEVEPVDGPVRLIVQSLLVANEEPVERDHRDPRVAAALRDPLVAVGQDVEDDGVILLHRTHGTELTMAAGMDHDIECPNQYDVEHEAREHWARTTVVTVLQPGQTLRVVKHLAYGWSGTRSAHALRDQVAAALTSARYAGWDTLVREQREYLDDFWEAADVEVDGDPILQQAVRFGLFQILQAGARTEGRAIGAKGLTGTGYDGHTFWDIEGFVLPVLTLLVPEHAERLLRWRAGTLDAARQRAEVLGWEGATFAWRTIDGHETSAYWPASTAAMHVNASVSRAFWLHGNVTGEGPDAAGALEVLVETARLWLSAGHVDAEGGWHLFGMTGPDEYTGVVDDNVFTNLMARRNLLRAADACALLPLRAAELGVTDEETARWREAAEHTHVPWDAQQQVHPANTGFTTYQEWPFAERQDSYPVQAHHHYSTIYRRQVIKQADLVQALWWCRDDFTEEELARDLAYYEARTVRDSSLSASTQAVVCARAQHPDLAHRYLRESALTDLRDLHGDARNGLHLASIGGSWLALVSGLGGLREDHEVLEVAPLLPRALSRLRYRLTWRGRLLQVETTRDGTTLTLLRGTEPVDVLVAGAPRTVRPGRPVTAPLREAAPLLPEPTQPVGRAPRV